MEPCNSANVSTGADSHNAKRELLLQRREVFDQHRYTDVMLIHTIVITPTWFMQMHILVFANKYALNTLSNVDVRYIHLYANVLFMHILMWVFFICRLFALACVIVQKKQGWWSLSPFLLPSLFRPIAILNKLIEKRMRGIDTNKRTCEWSKHNWKAEL